MSHVLITGGSRGIGEAMVRYFAQKGCHVSFTYRASEEKAKNLAKETGAFAICADGCDENAVASAYSQAYQQFGYIDVLINNAGISSYSLFQDVTTKEWEEGVQTNLRAPFFYIRQVLPSMIARKSGAIINISSIWGMVGASCEVLYSTTKAGLIGMTKALAKEVAPSGIRCNCIAPGVTETDMHRALDPDTQAAVLEEIPLGRVGTGEDIAKLAYFLAFEDSFTTGQVISPNGGMVV